MDYSTLLLWVSSILVFIQLLLFARNRPGRSKLPPGPTPLPIVGNLFKLGDKLHESLTELALIYGPIMTLRLGQVKTVVVSSSTMAKEVLPKHDHVLAGRDVGDALRVFNYNNMSMAWSQPNQYWRKLRSISNTHMFTNERLDSGQRLRRLKMQELLANMLEKSKKREAVDIGEAAFVAMINLISSTIFSMDLVDVDSGVGNEFNHLVWGFMEESGRPNIVDYFPMLRPLDPQGVRRRMMGYMKKGFAIIDEMIDRSLLVKGSSRESPVENDYLDALLDPSIGLTRKQVKSLIWELFTAGTDTISSTLEWCLTELLCNPNAMAKAQTELIETIGKGKEVVESDIAQLPYLQALVKETLRLHPPGPLLRHKALSNAEIGGYTIQKDSQVLVNVWAIGRDPHTWENPTLFMPERFMGSNHDYKGNDFEFLPFGAGRRICPGLPLASRMVHLMLASLLHSFAWKLPNGMTPKDLDMSNKIGITLRKAIRPPSMNNFVLAVTNGSNLSFASYIL